MRDRKAVRLFTTAVSMGLAIVYGAAYAAETLSDNEMDSVTAGIRVVSSAANSAFRADAVAEGLTADASAVVGGPSASANSSATSNAEFTGGASSVAHTTTVAPAPEPIASSSPEAESAGGIPGLRARIAELRALMRR